MGDDLDDGAKNEHQAIFSKSSNPPAKNLSGGCVFGVCTVVFPRQEKNLCHSRQQSAVACDASGKAEGFLAFDWCGGSQVASFARASFILHRSLSEELNEVDKPSISISSHARAVDAVTTELHFSNFNSSRSIVVHLGEVE
ncbi:hypothetical protein Bca52824_090553 [Brassica carinata]|uniref:Uncharacterized protein n=1 Tax=Brassica carinata TaxID=52824 RepID=A0A8X7NV16_BRACI|nr:hypothetical protein Bca52824_090553 [Brassica carinata]